MATARSNTSPAGGPASRVPGIGSARSASVFWSVLGAACVFGAFAAYAYLAPATYRTHAVVKLEAPEQLSKELPGPKEAVAAIRAAVLTQELFRELARLMGSDTPETRLRIANQIQSGLQVSAEARDTFAFTFTDSDAERAQKACNLVARRAAEVLPKVLLKVTSSAPPSPKQKKLEELLAFLAKHPEVSAASAERDSDTPSESARPKSVGDDPLIQALTTERRVAMAELAKLEAVDPNNPYADGVENEIRSIKARLRELNQGIAARREGLEGAARQATPPEKADEKQGARAELNEQWAAMLEQLMAEPDAKPAAPAPSGKGVVIREAGFPRWPVSPDRQLLLLLGSLAALVVAAGGVAHGMVSAKRAQAKLGKAPQHNEPARDLAHANANTEQTAPAPAALQQEAEPAGQPLMGPNHTPVMDVALLKGSPPDADGAQAPHHEARPGPSLTPGLGHTLPIDEPSPARTHAIADVEMPRTAMGGFVVLDTEGVGVSSDRPANHAESMGTMPRPISVREIPAQREVASDLPKEPEDNGPDIEVRVPTRTLEAEPSAAPVEPTASDDDDRMSDEPPARPNADGPGSRYQAPKRKHTQMLGSPTWVTGQKAASIPPESGRYSFVSHPPPPGRPDAGLQPPAAPREGGSTALARHRQRFALVATHPPPPGWTLDNKLVPESLGRLCQSLRNQAGQGCVVVGVTGFAELTAEKSRLAAGLAAGLAYGAHHRVLLLEGDFQMPHTHKTMGIEMPISAGFSQQLQLRRSHNHGRSGDNDEMPWLVVECIPTLHVLAEGVIRSPGAILSQQYEECIKELKGNYDFLIVDGPAVTSEVECRAFAQLVDGVVVGTPRAGMELPGEIHTTFHGRRFVIGHPCLP